MLVWDATCPDTYVPSHVPASVRGVGVALAEHTGESDQVRKPRHSHHFLPLVVETLGVLGEAAEDCMRELGRHLCKATGESHSQQFLYRICSSERKHIQLQSSAPWEFSRRAGSDFYVTWSPLSDPCMIMCCINTALMYASFSCVLQSKCP